LLRQIRPITGWIGQEARMNRILAALLTAALIVHTPVLYARGLRATPRISRGCLTLQ